jgi:hypothetical protein
MAYLYHPGHDASRVYYGTDTHLSGLLIGAAAALIWAPWKRSEAGRRPNPLLDIAGLAALAGLVYLMLTWGSDTTALYRGGFLVVALLSIVVVATVVHPGARLLRRGLSIPPLRWAGTRSYGLYLWHWPIIVVFSARALGWSQPWVLAFWFGLTALLTELSYRFVETPVRTGAIARWRARLAAADPDERARLAARFRFAGIALLFVIALLTVRIAKSDKVDIVLGGAQQTFKLASAPPGTAAGDPPPTTVNGALTTTVTSVAGTGGSTPTSGAAATSTPTQAPGGTTTLPASLPMKVAVVGDSQATALVRNAPDGLDQYLQLTNGGVSGCGLADKGDVITSVHFARDFSACKGWQAKWAANAKGNQLTLVVLGAWDVFDLAMPGGTLHFGTPESDAYLSAQLKSGIAAVEAVGSRVALLEIPCYRNVDGGGLIALPERSMDARTQHLNVLLRQAAADDPTRVTFVPGPTQWCSDPSIATNLGYRWDGVHYYRPGSKLVFDTITPELLQIPVGK